MKKILLILTLFVFSFLGFTTKTVMAYEFETFYDITNEWNTYNYTGTVYGIRISYYDFPTISGQDDSVTYKFSITIPQNDYNIQTVSGVDSELVLYNSSHSTLFSYDLDDLLGDGLFGEIIIETEFGNIYAPSHSYYGLDMSSVASFSINMMINDTSIPSGYYNDWVTTSPVGFYVNAVQVNFYTYINSGTGVKLSLYDTQFLFNTNADIVADPTPPTNWATRNFLGWLYFSPITNQYEYYDFDDPILENMLDDGETIFNLYAKFSDSGTPDITDPENPTSDVPEKLQDILDIFNMNNDEGYLLFYFILHLFMVLLTLVVKRLTGTVPLLISSVLITVIFMVFGMLPIYISLPMILLYIILFSLKVHILTSDNGGDDYEE